MNLDLSHNLTREHHAIIAAAFREGVAAAKVRRLERGDLRRFDVRANVNPYREGHMMPVQMASVRCAKWHAFAAGVDFVADGIKNAGTVLRNARYCMSHAIRLGRA